jgi:hypothetical protein
MEGRVPAGCSLRSTPPSADESKLPARESFQATWLHLRIRRRGIARLPAMDAPVHQSLPSAASAPRPIRRGSIPNRQGRATPSGMETGTITRTAAFSGHLTKLESRMRDSQDREGSIRFRTFAVIAVAFILAVAILTWGPWNTEHVASNPGPSGTPGSTAVDQTPPPAAEPSGTPTGAAR